MRCVDEIGVFVNMWNVIGLSALAIVLIVIALTVYAFARGFIREMRQP